MHIDQIQTSGVEPLEPPNTPKGALRQHAQQSERFLWEGISGQK